MHADMHIPPDVHHHTGANSYTWPRTCLPSRQAGCGQSGPEVISKPCQLFVQVLLRCVWWEGGEWPSTQGPAIWTDLCG
jgi:hypothetical protein